MSRKVSMVGCSARGHEMSHMPADVRGVVEHRCRL